MADIDQNLRAALRTVAEDGRRGAGRNRESGASLRKISERRQAQHRALAAISLAVVAVLVGGGIVLHGSSTKPPPSGPGPTPSAAAPTIPASAMLSAADLPDAIIALTNPYPGEIFPQDITDPDWSCAPAPSSGATARTVGFHTGTGSVETWIDQRAESFADATQAAAAMNAMVRGFTSCATSSPDVTLDQVLSETGIGDAPAVILRATIPGLASANANHVVWFEIARTGRVLTWVGVEYYTQDVWPAQDIALRRAVARLCSLGGGACVTEPVVRTTTFEAPLPQVDPSTVTPELLAGSLGSHWAPTGDQVLDPPYPCSSTVSDYTGPNTPGVVIRAWASDLVDTYGAEIVRSNLEVGEAIRPYATAQAAVDGVGVLANAFDSCTDPTPQRMGSALVWKQDNGRTWFAFGTKGTHVLTLQVRTNGAAQPPTLTEVNALLDAALARLP